MNDSKVFRLTGAFGAAAGALLLVASPLYIMMCTPPSITDAARFTDYVTRSNIIGITTKLTDTLYIAGFIVFLTGLRHLIRRARPDYAKHHPGRVPWITSRSRASIVAPDRIRGTGSRKARRLSKY